MSRIWLLVTLLYLASPQSMAEKRVPKCSGCGERHNNNLSGQPGSFCTGPEREDLVDDLLEMTKVQSDFVVKFRPRSSEQSPFKESYTSDPFDGGNLDIDDQEIALLQEKIENLSIHEERV